MNDSRVRRFQTGLHSCIASCTRQISRPAGNYAFVLVGFQLSYQGEEHHIDEVGILEKNGRLTVWLNDQNDDDRFQWQVQYAYVPMDLIRQLGASLGSRQRTADRRSIPAGLSAIRGFKFDFKPYFTSGNDHQIKDIGVLTPNRDVEVFYADKNGDDGFDWQVEWAILK